MNNYLRRKYFFLFVANKNAKHPQMHNCINEKKNTKIIIEQSTSRLYITQNVVQHTIDCFYRHL